MLDAIDPTTTVIPGHGPISNYEGLQTYIEMLTDMHETIGKMVDRGRSLEEVIAAKPTAKWDAQFGDSANFVNRAYTSIKKARSN